MKYILILILFSGPAWAKIDLVFDLDQTLVYHLFNYKSKNKTVYHLAEFKENYVLSDWAVEIIQELYESGEYRISFFSGGTEKRNKVLLEMIKLPSGKSLLDISYKTLHRKDLTPIPNALLDGPISKRFFKSLDGINTDLDNVIVVDDNLNFYPEQMKDNVHWVGDGYLYFDQWEDAQKAKTKNTFKHPKHWFPENELSFWTERNKLVLIYGELEEALSLTKKENISFKEALMKATRENGTRVDRNSKNKLAKVMAVTELLSRKYSTKRYRLKNFCPLLLQ